MVLNKPERIVIKDEERISLLNALKVDVLKLWPKQLKKELVGVLLASNEYEYLEINDDEKLKENLKKKVEELNRKDPKKSKFRFTEWEWNWFYREHFEGYENEGYINRTKKIQAIEFRKILKLESGGSLNIDLLDKRKLENNSLQILGISKDKNENSCDLAVLVNGLPLVYIEIKPRTESLQDAFNNDRNNKDVFFSKLFEFIQIFVISNGEDTKYYGNTVRNKPDKKSFQYTSFWSAWDNEPIKNLILFGQTFLKKNTILQMLTKYCVFDTREVMKVLRPYQIAAIEGIVRRVFNFISEGNIKGKNYGGYVWHTTGSGKTLTSFKASKLISEFDEIDKVIFVVDRKSLDSQTTAEYISFLGDGDKETIDTTSNVSKLKELLERSKESNKKKKIIITTIQKFWLLFRFDNEKEKHILKEEVFNKKIVMIMDECHRSQGEKIRNALKHFKNLCLFGFTGTPLIKKDKLRKGEIVNETKLYFTSEIHTYKIIDAISDENVLGFWIDYVTARQKLSKPVADRNVENPERIASVVKYILRNFDKKASPTFIGESVEGTKKPRFNSIFAVKSIPVAIEYYKEFKRQLEKFPKENFKVAIIFSAQDNKDEEDIDEENFDDEEINVGYRTFLQETIIKGDYREDFGLESSSFDNYRSSVSDNVKDKKIDILIVVNMFLTGFDALTLNTLWIDKNLTSHNLIQAFSRTNRIYGKSKPHGNIICFRDMKKEVDDALITFAGRGDKECLSQITVPSFQERKEEFMAIEKKLKTQFPLSKELTTDAEKKEFVDTWKKFMSLGSSLSCDEDFAKCRTITPEEIHEYKARYLNVYENYKKKRERNVDDYFDDEIISFDLELSTCNEVDVDYIISLLAEYAKKQGRSKEEIMRFVRSSSVLRKEEDVIEEYLDKVDAGEVSCDYKEFKQQKLNEKVEKLALEEDLDKEGISEFIKKSITRNFLSFDGTNVRTKIMPKMDLTKNYKEYKTKWFRVEGVIRELFEKFKQSW